MAWYNISWSCSHNGRMQLYGAGRKREGRIAYEAGRKCLACWLVEQWEKTSDPRAKREDRYLLAGQIAAKKLIDIYNLPESVPVKK